MLTRTSRAKVTSAQGAVEVAAEAAGEVSAEAPARLAAESDEPVGVGVGPATGAAVGCGPRCRIDAAGNCAVDVDVTAERRFVDVAAGERVAECVAEAISGLSTRRVTVAARAKRILRRSLRFTFSLAPKVTTCAHRQPSVEHDLSDDSHGSSIRAMMFM
jgi:hypothetical protein